MRYLSTPWQPLNGQCSPSSLLCMMRRHRTVQLLHSTTPVLRHQSSSKEGSPCRYFHAKRVFGNFSLACRSLHTCCRRSRS